MREVEQFEGRISKMEKLNREKEREAKQETVWATMEDESDKRLLDVYRSLNEQLETKFEVANTHIVTLEVRMTQINEEAKQLRKQIYEF